MIVLRVCSWPKENMISGAWMVVTVPRSHDISNSKNISKRTAGQPGSIDHPEDLPAIFLVLLITAVRAFCFCAKRIFSEPTLDLGKSSG
jgi:hypothetical protein